MSIEVQGEGFPLADQDVKRLWEEVRQWCGCADESVVVRTVTRAEIEELNVRYRGKQSATNVLTFSYGEGEHDMAICLSVAAEEAAERGMTERDYVALLVVHGLLHVAGMDHERSQDEEEQTQRAEQEVLARAGFGAQSL